MKTLNKITKNDIISFLKKENEKTLDKNSITKSLFKLKLNKKSNNDIDMSLSANLKDNKNNIISISYIISVKDEYINYTLNKPKTLKKISKILNKYVNKRSTSIIVYDKNNIKIFQASNKDALKILTSAHIFLYFEYYSNINNLNKSERKIHDQFNKQYQINKNNIII